MAADLLRIRATVTGRAEASSLLKFPGDAVLVERGRPRLLVLSCPCGCGEEVPINLDSRAGPAWHYYTRPKYGVSLFPSVWRDTGCRSHFIVWRDHIWLFGPTEDTFEEDRSSLDGTSTVEAVLEQLPESFVAFASIAEQLDAVPWDVLAICRRLVRRGLAIEGKGKQRGHFRRA